MTSEPTFDLDAFLSEISARLVDVGGGTPQPETTGEYERSMLFRVGHATFGITLSHALEVIRRPNITPVPGVPGWVAGVYNLHGEIISVVRLSVFLGKPREDSTTMLVMDAGDQTIGMLVSSVETIYAYPLDAILSPIAVVEPELVNYLRGVIHWRSETVRLLDCERLLTGQEMQQFRA